MTTDGSPGLFLTWAGFNSRTPVGYKLTLSSLALFLLWFCSGFREEQTGRNPQGLIIKVGYRSRDIRHPARSQLSRDKWVPELPVLYFFLPPSFCKITAFNIPQNCLPRRALGNKKAWRTNLSALGPLYSDLGNSCHLTFRGYSVLPSTSTRWPCIPIRAHILWRLEIGETPAATSDTACGLSGWNPCGLLKC